METPEYTDTTEIAEVPITACPVCNQDTLEPVHPEWRACSHCKSLLRDDARAGLTEISITTDGTVNIVGTGLNVLELLQEAYDRCDHGGTITFTTRLKHHNTLGRAISIHRAGKLKFGLLPTESGIRYAANCIGLKFIKRVDDTLTFMKV